MCRLLSVVIIILVMETLFYSSVSGYKWVHVKPGYKIPAGAKLLNADPDRYVGRARHYDELLPAEVHNTSVALITSCSKVIEKYEFEILLLEDVDHCRWSSLSDNKSVPENIVRVGNQWNGEPIYLGAATDTKYARIASILLTSQQVLRWEGASGSLYALTCKDNNEWVDTPSVKIPKHALSGGTSNDNNDMYVARLKKGCDIIPGQVIPALGIATALYNGNDIKSAYCQVLIEDTTASYIWVSAENGEIPENAVVAAKSQNNELMYVARINNTLGYITYSEAKASQIDEFYYYDVLTKAEP